MTANPEEVQAPPTRSIPELIDYWTELADAHEDPEERIAILESAVEELDERWREAGYMDEKFLVAGRGMWPQIKLKDDADEYANDYKAGMF